MVLHGIACKCTNHAKTVKSKHANFGAWSLSLVLHVDHGAPIVVEHADPIFLCAQPMQVGGVYLVRDIGDRIDLAHHLLQHALVAR